jgi:hypothetical protein
MLQNNRSSRETVPLNCRVFLQMSNVQDARREMTKTKEQLEEEKKISLSIRIKPLELDGKTPSQHPDQASGTRR